MSAALNVAVSVAIIGGVVISAELILLRCSQWLQF